MVRIAGILCGSAISVSFLIIALGVPEFRSQPELVPESTTYSGVQTIPGPAAESESVAESLVTTEPTVEAVTDAAVQASAEPAVESADEMAEGTDKEMVAETQSPPPPPVEHWYAFWSPFRSELAANGFVSQLQRTTGMDYRVVRVKPGVYEVAFAYEAENDIESKLAAISAATGLEMPDG